MEKTQGESIICNNTCALKIKKNMSDNLKKVFVRRMKVKREIKNSHRCILKKIKSNHKKKTS